MSGAVRQVCVHLLSYSGVHTALYKYSSVYTYFLSYSFLIILLSWPMIQLVNYWCLRYRIAHNEAQKPAFLIYYIRGDAWFGISDTTLVFNSIWWFLETWKSMLTCFFPLLSSITFTKCTSSFQPLTILPTCVWDLLSFTFNQLQLNQQDEECGGVLCCLLYIWQQSLEYSCHKTLSVTTFVLLMVFFLQSVALPMDSSDFFLYILNVLLTLHCPLSLPLLHCKADKCHHRWGIRLCFMDITWLCFWVQGFCGRDGKQMFLLCILMDNCVLTVCL